MNPGNCKTWLTPPSPHVSSSRKNLRPWTSNNLNQAYLYWEVFESESDHVKNVQTISAGKVLDQIRTLYPEGLGKKGLDLDASWFFISEGIGVFCLYVKYDLEEDSWSIEFKSPIYDYFNGYRQTRTLSFKTGQEVLDWLQTHPPKSVSDSIFELARPVVLAYHNFENGMYMKINL